MKQFCVVHPNRHKFDTCTEVSVNKHSAYEQKLCAVFEKHLVDGTYAQFMKTMKHKISETVTREVSTV